MITTIFWICIGVMLVSILGGIISAVLVLSRKNAAGAIMTGITVLTTILFYPALIGAIITGIMWVVNNI